MKLPPATSGWQGVVCCFAVIAVFGSLGCNKARRRYPTISAPAQDGGNASVHGDFNHCPRAMFVATPDHAPIGRPITLTATATDQDGDALAYDWAAPSGAFSSEDEPMITFTCDRNGAVTITL